MKKETKEQKIARIAVGLAVADNLVELAFTRTISEFNRKLNAHRFNRKYDRQINMIGFTRSEFWHEVKNMKKDPDYNNPEIAYDDDEHDKP